MAELSGNDYAERRRSVARQMQRRMVEHLAAGGTTDFAAAPMENDPAVYSDAQRAERERRAIFGTLPLLAGFSQDAPEPGDCLLFDEADLSAVIVRGRDGVLRAFRNLCTHRGSRLVRTCERRTRLTCPFHGWSYQLDGALEGIPGRSGFEDVDWTQRNLVPVAVAERHGMVFVQAEGTMDADAFLGTFGPELAQLELGRAAPLKTSVVSAETNWKLAIDTYAEGYHFGVLHASTIGRTHYSNVAVYDAFGPHWRLNFPEKSLRALVGVDEREWPELEFGGIHFLFPNTVMVVGAGFVRVFRIFPGRSAGTMRCQVAVYASGGVVTEEQRAQFANDNGEDVVTQEDYRVAVEAYANLLHAPPGFRVVYGRNEIAVQSFHRHVQEYLDRDA